MEGTTRIQLLEIRELCDRTLAALEQAVDGDLDLHIDYFWSIPRAERYNVYSQPSELTVGQVSEELENLRRLAEQGDASFVPQSLRWLGSILTAIGDELTP
jgi:hypothetical protein